MLYYQYATQYKNDSALIDNNETGQGRGRNSGPFPFVSSRTHYGDELKGNGPIKSIKLDYIKKIPAYGAYSFKIDPSVWSGIPDRQEGVLRVKLTNNSLPLTFSLLNESRWFSINAPDKIDNASHKYGTISVDKPEIRFGDLLVAYDAPFFITLVNPHSSDVTISDIAIEIRERFYRQSGTPLVIQTSGVMWLDDAAAMTRRLTWLNSKANCDSLVYGGFDDWQLPKESNLFRVLKYSKYSVFENIVKSSNVGGNAYITRTELASNPNVILGVTFSSVGIGTPSSTFTSSKDSNREYHSACVRDFIRM